jgi:hypothetical protein
LDPAGVLATGKTDTSGFATFYLPTGRFNLTASDGNSTAFGSVIVSAGQSQEVVLGASRGEPWGAIGLYSAAAIGVAANVAMWLRGRERRPPGQATSPSQ